MSVHDEVKACCWMISHYSNLANSVWETYPSIVDAYLVYDHYMIYVKKYQDRLDDIFED